MTHDHYTQSRITAIGRKTIMRLRACPLDLDLGLGLGSGLHLGPGLGLGFRLRACPLEALLRKLEESLIMN